jgi:hypothetical protein
VRDRSSVFVRLLLWHYPDMSTPQWASLISAVAATLAAIFAGINLRLTARREHLSWVRSALEGAFVDFLTASFNHKNACNQMASLAMGERGRRSSAEWQEVADKNHHIMMDCLTRFRVLAGDDMAELALAVQAHNEKAMQLIWDGEFDLYEATRRERRAAFGRDQARFSTRARQLLGAGRRL